MLVGVAGPEREGLARALGDAPASVHVEQAACRDELALRLTSGVYDLVIAFGALPTASVSDIVRAVRDRDEHCPVLVVAPAGQEAEVLQAIRDGATDFVVRDSASLAQIVSAVHAVIERARTARRAVWAELRLRALLEQLRVGVFRATFDGEVIEANRAFADILGFEDEKCARGFALHGEGLGCAVGVRLRNALHARGQARVEEVELRRPDGRTIWVSVTESLGLSDDGNTVIDGLLEDITERKRAAQELRRREKHFRSLIENALDLIGIVDEQGVVRYASESYSRLLGMKPDEVIGRLCDQCVHPDDVERMRSYRKRWSEGAPPDVEAPIRLRHADGSWRWFEVRGKRLEEDFGVRGVVINARDVTERLAAERELAESEKRLRQAQKMEAVGRLAGGVAHDFNNVITSVLGHCDLILDHLHEGDPLRADVEEIVRAAERAASLTRQLLAFSREQVVQPSVLRIGRVLGELDRMLRRLIGEDVELVVRSQPNEPAVRIDRGQLEQVVMNLAVNARDAMPSGGRLVIESGAFVLDHDQARSFGLEAAGRYAFVRVEDTGFGIDDETLIHVFEPFFTTKEAGKGTGLGLATVYAVVTQAGGGIKIETELGRGTAFTIALPALEPGADEHESLEAADFDERKASGASGSETILLVEDDELVRSLVHRVLRRGGYRVLEADNAGEALLICETHPEPIDVLLTDVVMPRMSGPDVAERLRKIRPDLKVLFMSGYPAREVDRVERGEATDYLSKPFTPQTLYRRLRALLDRGAGR